MAFLDEYRAIGGDAAAQARLALVGAWLKTRPRELFAELRRSRPMLQTPGFLLVTRFPDVQEVLGHERVFSVRLYAGRMDPVAGPFMLARDGTIFNERDKSVMRVMLRPDDLPRVRELVAKRTDENLDAHKGPKGVELVGAVTRRVPIQLCGDYFGFPGPSEEAMMRWSRATQMDMFRNPTQDPAIHQASVQAGAEMRAFLRDYIPKRRAALAKDPGPDDTLCRLLKTQLPAVVGFDEERVLANTMGLLIGAGETTSQAAVQVLDQFFQRPEVFAEATAAAREGGDDRLAALVWEALRFNPISPGILRYCEEDYVLARGTDRETLVPKGRVVMAATLSAMFDERELPEPEAFRPGRPAHHYFHFGYGHHLCLGYAVGLVMIPEMLRRLLLRPNLRRASGDRGAIDYKGGPFPEECWVQFD